MPRLPLPFASARLAHRQSRPPPLSHILKLASSLNNHNNLALKLAQTRAPIITTQATPTPSLTTLSTLQHFVGKTTAAAEAVAEGTATATHTIPDNLTPLFPSTLLANILRLRSSSPLTTRFPPSLLPPSSSLFASAHPLSPISSRFSPLGHSGPRPYPNPNPHPRLILQIRTRTSGTEYQPSQRVRKRRHGFLARKRSIGGRKVLIRRKAKGRRFLSH